MKNLTLYILIAISIILGVIYFYEIRREHTLQESMIKSHMLFPDFQGEPESIILNKKDSKIILKKESKDGKALWTITSPIKTEADEKSVKEFIRVLKHLKYQRLVASQVDNLSVFGLDNPVLVITFQKGNKKKRLFLGNISPVKDGYYAMKPEQKDIFLIPLFDAKILHMNLYQLRNKRLFSIRCEDIKHLEITRGNEIWRFLKKNKRWIFQGEDEFPVDEKKINQFLRQILNAQASSFEGGASQNLHNYGLNPPFISIFLSDGLKEEGLLVGSEKVKDENGTHWAILKGKNQLITIDKTLLDIIPLKKEAFKRLD